MEQMKVKVGLIPVLKIYLSRVKENIYGYFVFLVVGITIPLTAIQVASLGIIDGVLIKFIASVLTSYLIYFQLRRLCNSKGSILLKKYLIITSIGIIYSLISLLNEVMIIELPEYRAFGLQIVSIIIEISLAVFIYKLAINNNWKANENADILYLIKFGVFYFIAKILTLFIYGIVILRTIGNEGNRLYLLAPVGIISMVLYLPISIIYFEAKVFEEKKLGINI